MNVTEHLLTCLAEEGGELTQAATKSLRFGLQDIGPGLEQTNKERLEAEIADLLGVVELLQQYRIIGAISENAIAQKRVKVRTYMDYAVKVGTLTDHNTPERKETALP